MEAGFQPCNYETFIRKDFQITTQTNFSAYPKITVDTLQNLQKLQLLACQRFVLSFLSCGTDENGSSGDAPEMHRKIRSSRDSLQLQTFLLVNLENVLRREEVCGLPRIWGLHSGLPFCAVGNLKPNRHTAKFGNEKHNHYSHRLILCLFSLGSGVEMRTRIMRAGTCGSLLQVMYMLLALQRHGGGRVPAGAVPLKAQAALQERADGCHMSASAFRDY